MVLVDLDVRGQLRGRTVEGDGVVELHLQGELDLATSTELVRWVAGLDVAGPGEVALDLADLRFVDLAGMRALEEACNLLGRRGCRARMRNARGPVRRLFALAAPREVLPA